MNKFALQPYFLLALLMGSSILAYYIFSPFLISIALAAIFAVALRPLYGYIGRYVVWPGVAAGLTILLCIVCILVPLWFLSTLVVSQAQQLYLSLSSGTGQVYLLSTAQHIEATFHAYFPSAAVPDIYGSFSLYVRTALAWLADHLGAIVSSLASVLLSFFVFSFALYYFLCDGVQFKKALIALSPLQDSDNEAILSRLELAINSVIRGNLTVALIQGAVTAASFTIFGLPNSILWGLVGSIASLIPGFGSSLVILPAALFLYITGHSLEALELTIVGLAVVGAVDNIVKPKLLGRGMQLHPLVVLLSVLGGLSLWGPVGIFLGPLCISLLFAVLAIYSKLFTKAVTD